MNCEVTKKNAAIWLKYADRRIEHLSSFTAWLMEIIYKAETQN
jgi:hypothetical protein